MQMAGIELMSFQQEPTGYEKTILSDLQGAWINLRDAVVQHCSPPDLGRLLFHIDEGMSWESVRDFDKMKQALLLVENIAHQTDVHEDVTFWLKDVRVCFEDACNELSA
ncbi:hypothetical protein GCM10023116_12090 [Kistimonas scapharcae]|uniref:Uncharacterized protein n=2 Tax=Kistimonas scapharcae TaxID=1036133 RepID=A0ABP8V1H1_9GAMM